MAGPTPQATPEAIPGIYRDAQEVLRISGERFDIGRQLEALDAEDPQVILAILEPLRQLGTPNLARLSVGDYLESACPDEFTATQDFLTRKRLIAQGGKTFTAGEMATLALPVYLARKDEAAEAVAGSAPIKVRKHSRALVDAITLHQPDGDTRVSGTVEGTVDHADTKAGVLELVPVSEGSTEEDTSYHIEPVKTRGVNAGKPQVSIEAAPVEA